MMSLSDNLPAHRRLPSQVVSDLAEDLPEQGSTKAVSAGKTPKGQARAERCRREILSRPVRP